MTITMPDLTEAQAEAARRVDDLDLEPITYKLMYPELGQAAMTLAEADERVSAYRCYLKLCAWYPDESIVPSKPIDEVWHAHQLDSPKYAPDCDAVFGYFLHHFPYFGMRGADDAAALRAAFDRTRELFRRHFGIELSSGNAAPSCSSSCQAGTGEGTQCSGSGCHGAVAAELAADCDNGSLCVPEGTECDKRTAALADARPRPDRSVMTR